MTHPQVSIDTLLEEVLMENARLRWEVRVLQESVRAYKELVDAHGGDEAVATGTE